MKKNTLLVLAISLCFAIAITSASAAIAFAQNENDKIADAINEAAVNVDSEGVMEGMTEETIAGDDPVIFVEGEGEDTEVTSQNIDD